MELAKLEFEHLHADIKDIKETLNAMTVALQRLAALEERFAFIATQIQTLESQISALDKRQHQVENDLLYAKASAQTLANTGKIAWALGGGLAVTFLSKLAALVV